MSRDKFEEWARSKGYDLDKLEEEFESLLTCAAHEGWLAGRESMRDEAANACEGFKERNASSIAAKCSQEIRKIEP